jgi:hypothetical protein
MSKIFYLWNSVLPSFGKLFGHEVAPENLITGVKFASCSLLVQ